MNQSCTMRRARRRLGWFLGAAAALAPLAAAAPVRAEDDSRIASLSQTLSTSSSDKERISAVTALGRLGDKRALRPLVSALRDHSAMVRAVAAAALGKLGHRAALPALRTACDDDDALVRKRAQQAMSEIYVANGMDAPAPEPAPVPRGRAGFGSQPRALSARPDLYVVVRTTADDSQRADTRARQVNSDILRSTMLTALRSEPMVTSAAADASRYGLTARHVDLTITKLEQHVVGGYVEIEAQLRLAISDSRGKMESFLSGGAKVQVPRRSFDARYLPQVKREALENAVKGLFDKLIAHLRRTPSS